MCTSTRLGCDLHSAYTSACLQEVCAPGTAPITVQIIDTTSSNLQLDSADIMQELHKGHAYALGNTLSQFDVQTITTGYMTSSQHVFTPSEDMMSS